MKIKELFFLLVIGILFSGCADVSNIQFLDSTEHVYGFWGGVWHGMITIPSFIGSLFSDNIAIYAVNNNGAWYDFGFVGGLGMILRLLGTVVGSIRKKD